MTHSTAQLAVIVPIFNEQAILWENLAFFGEHLDRVLGAGAWLYVLVDNGSRDATPQVVHRLCQRWPASVPVRLERADIGNALRVGLQQCQAPWAHLINVEQWDLPFLEWAWEQRAEHDLFVGSKGADPTLNEQSTYRRFLSWGLGAALQLLLEFPGSETHGPKLLRMDAMRPILDVCVMRRGQFDTELTLRALRAGLRVAEAPVPYREQRPPRNFMARKIGQNLYDLRSLWRELGGVPYAPGGLRLKRYHRAEVLAAGSLPEDETRLPASG